MIYSINNIEIFYQKKYLKLHVYCSYDNLLRFGLSQLSLCNFESHKKKVSNNPNLYKKNSIYSNKKKLVNN